MWSHLKPTIKFCLKEQRNFTAILYGPESINKDDIIFNEQLMGEEEAFDQSYREKSCGVLEQILVSITNYI